MAERAAALRRGSYARIRSLFLHDSLKCRRAAVSDRCPGTRTALRRRLPHMKTMRRRLGYSAIAMTVITVVAVGGYRLFGGPDVTFLQALYMAIITIAGVGYAEIVDTSHNPTLRIFNMLVVAASVVITLYAFSVLTAFLVEGELRNLFWRRTMEKRIRELKDHFIICGLGDTGRYAVQELHKTGAPYVLVDGNEETIKRFQEQEDGKFREALCITGDATDPVVLDEAGLDRARGIIAALANDMDNLVITVMVRQKTHNVRIVARCTEVSFAERLIKAGANTAVSPNAIGGLRLASEALRPHVTGFLDMMLREKTRTLRIDEIVVPAGSPWSGQCLQDIKFRARYHLVPLAIKSAIGEKNDYLFNPPESLALQPGSIIIVMGDVEEVHRARKDALAHDEAVGISS